MSWVDTVTEAKESGFAFFDFLAAVDLEAEGFQVVVHLWNPVARAGTTLTTQCPRANPTVPTITDVFAGAAWHERAAAELFGIRFEGHDTAHLVLSERFDGHPLRKDFVLASRVARRWPGAKEPGESDDDLATSTRRRPRPPGVPG